MKLSATATFSGRSWYGSIGLTETIPGGVAPLDVCERNSRTLMWNKTARFLSNPGAVRLQQDTQAAGTSGLDVFCLATAARRSPVKHGVVPSCVAVFAALLDSVFRSSLTMILSFTVTRCGVFIMSTHSSGCCRHDVEPPCKAGP